MTFNRRVFKERVDPLPSYLADPDAAAAAVRGARGPAPDSLEVAQRDCGLMTPTLTRGPHFACNLLLTLTAPHTSLMHHMMHSCELAVSWRFMVAPLQTIFV